MVRQTTIFSQQRHSSSHQAKKFGYNLSKAAVVGTIIAGLVGVGTFQAFAGSNHKNNSGPQKHTIKNVKKTTVKAKAGNKNNYGNSNSRASVNNSIGVNVGGANRGGSAPSLNRGGNGGNNNGGNNKKKVVRKKVVKRTVDNSYIDTSYVDNSYVDNSYKEVDISVKQTNECGDCYNNSVEYTYKPSKPSYHKNDDHDYDTGKKDYSHRESKTTNNTYVENNNNSDNYNDNSQYLDVSFPQYYD